MDTNMINKRKGDEMINFIQIKYLNRKFKNGGDNSVPRAHVVLLSNMSKVHECKVHVSTKTVSLSTFYLCTRNEILEFLHFQ